MNRTTMLITAAILLAGFLYCLNRGIYVGSDVTGDILYTKHCRYLFISGISEVPAGIGLTREGAGEQSRGCSLLAR
jgi:hypothetical protein